MDDWDQHEKGTMNPVIAGSQYEFVVPRGSLSENWCCIFIGLIGIAMFIMGAIAYFPG